MAAVVKAGYWFHALATTTHAIHMVQGGSSTNAAAPHSHVSIRRSTRNTQRTSQTPTTNKTRVRNYLRSCATTDTYTMRVPQGA